METYSFPPAHEADEESGLLGVGANWAPGTLIDAYSKGIFPWPHPDLKEIPWFSPPERALLMVEDYKPNRKLVKDLRNSNFCYSANTNFQGVIKGCRTTKRKKHKGLSNESWITDEMQEAYIELYKLGYAHSVEVLLQGKLVGGIYGVMVNNIFSAESMFREANNASKASFHLLVQVLRDIGIKYLDCQIISPHLSSWGVKEVGRDTFLNLIEKDFKVNKKFPCGTLELAK